MKKILSVSLLGFILLSLLPHTGYGQDVQSILNKMIDAIGGRKVLEGIKDTTFTGTMELIQYGMTGVVTFYHKEPNKYRQDVEVMGMVITTATDGEVGWMINPQTGSVETMSGSLNAEFNSQALSGGFSYLLEPEKYGISFTDKGKETIDGKEYIVLEQTSPGDLKSTHYIDPETYLIHRSKSMVTDPQMGTLINQETVMDDFREVDGIMFAHTVIIFQDGTEFGSMTVEGLKFNSGLEDSYFKR